MRFIIHHHSGEKSGTDHLDFMIETESGLATWRVAVEDMTRLRNGESVPAQKIADHRKEYLSYEGPVSHDRGKVSIVDTGGHELLVSDSETMKYALFGKVLIGYLLISRVSGDIFSFRFGENLLKP